MQFGNTFVFEGACPHPIRPLLIFLLLLSLLLPLRYILEGGSAPSLLLANKEGGKERGKKRKKRNATSLFPSISVGSVGAC